jgi:predicted small metal-binding protein
LAQTLRVATARTELRRPLDVCLVLVPEFLPRASSTVLVGVSMTRVLKCRDLEDTNPKCPFEWRGQSDDEILTAAAEHLVFWHRPRNIPGLLLKAKAAIRVEHEARSRAAGVASSDYQKR